MLSGARTAPDPAPMGPRPTTASLTMKRMLLLFTLIATLALLLLGCGTDVVDGGPLASDDGDASSDDGDASSDDGDQDPPPTDTEPDPDAVTDDDAAGDTEGDAADP